MKKQFFVVILFALLNNSCQIENIRPILPDFSYTETIDGNVQFINKTEGNPLFFEWDFGTGDNSKLENPSYTFPRNGDYTVYLSAYSRKGREYKISKTVRITTKPTTGRFMFFTRVSNAGFIDIYVSGVYEGRLTKFFTQTTDPACGADGTLTITRPAGTYSFTARSTTGISWSGNLTIQNGKCRFTEFIR